MTNESAEPLHIISLEASNYKRLKAVRIVPDGKLVYLAGRNAQGKTSVLDAIWAALAGGDASKLTTQPIREGESQASVKVDLGEYVVTRRWTSNGVGSLTVESPRGAKYSSPQTLLDGLLGRFAFDPLAFAQSRPADQVATLLQVVDLPFDPDALDAERRSLYEQRTEVNRDRKRGAAELESLGPAPEGAPEREVSMAELLERLTGIDEHNDTVRRAMERHQRHIGLRSSADDAVVRAEQKLAEAREELAEARNEETASAKEVAALEPQDRAPVVAALEQADEINAAVRLKGKIDEAATRLAVSVADAAELDRLIAEIDQRKADGLAAASFPVEGLSFDTDGVTFNGIPFKQASDAEQLRVSVALAMAQNPTLRVLRIDRAESLDKEGVALIAAMAEERDYQVWMSRVDESGDIGVVIEDGEVRVSER